MSEDESIQGICPDDSIGISVPELWSLDRILALGEAAARKISGFSNEVISLIGRSYEIDSADLLSKLNYLMKSFDKGDFKSRLSGGLLFRLFPMKKRSADKLYEKYIAFSKEIDKIFIEIKKYEYVIRDTNEELGKMYEEALKYHSELEDQIQYGKTYLSGELEPWILTLRQHAASDNSITGSMNSRKFEEVRELLEQRIYDLELSKALSLQTAPVIKLIQKGNSSLIRKMNSAFIVTLPLFRQTVIQAITRKRQKIYTDSMSALDTSSNRLLHRNAKGFSKSVNKFMQADQDSPGRIKAIEESYNIIINGIKEFGLIHKENMSHRDSGIHQLENIRNSFTALKPEQVHIVGLNKTDCISPGGRK